MKCINCKGKGYVLVGTTFNTAQDIMENQEPCTDCCGTGWLPDLDSTGALSDDRVQKQAGRHHSMKRKKFR